MVTAILTSAALASGNPDIVTISEFVCTTRHESEPPQESRISFVRAGNRLRAVQVFGPGYNPPYRATIPLARDWRGRANGENYRFSLRRQGWFGEIDVMRAPDIAEGYRIAWRQVIGMGSHVPIESGGTGECTMVSQNS